jgi:ABC-type nitrate/sulfonate/bicarbonate transport system substrate-binding protein
MKRLIALALATFAPAALAAQTLQVIVFAGGANWPLWVAQDRGHFAAHGLEVQVTPTPGSVFLVQNLVGGKFDIGFMTFDNIPAYDEGQGEVALERPANLFAFMGGLTGGLRLMVNPGIKSFADLKGKAMGVDSPDTGYSLMMRKMLERGGLAESDYRYENLGGTGERTEALMQNRTMATIVTSPLDLLPLAKGYRVLADSREVGPYQATLYVARREWAAAHEADLVAFVAAQLEALRWLADPAHRDEAVAIYRQHLPKASEQGAQKAWEALLTREDEGLTKDGRIDMAGVATVLKLRGEYGRPKKELGDASRYVDESYYRKATQQGGGAK